MSYKVHTQFGRKALAAIAENFGGLETQEYRESVIQVALKLLRTSGLQLPDSIHSYPSPISSVVRYSRVPTVGLFSDSLWELLKVRL